jgi:hypothetical protein
MILSNYLHGRVSDWSRNAVMENTVSACTHKSPPLPHAPNQFSPAHILITYVF